MSGFNRNNYEVSFNDFYDGFITAIKHINRGSETDGDLSPSLEFSRFLQRQKDELEFLELFDSMNPKPEPTDDEVNDWFWN